MAPRIHICHCCFTGHYDGEQGDHNALCGANIDRLRFGKDAALAVAGEGISATLGATCEECIARAERYLETHPATDFAAR